MDEHNDILLKRIANHLIINARFLNNPGLYQGKMGIVLFFVHYAAYTGQAIYDDFAGELMDDIYKELKNDMVIDFENGLCGIGWGIDYLLENHFMEGESAHILAQIDKKIMERDLIRISDYSEKKGLLGISYYIKKHTDLNASSSKKVFDDKYMENWKETTAGMDIKEKHLSEIFQAFDADIPIQQWSLGLEYGCSGYGLRVMNIK